MGYQDINQNNDNTEKIAQRFSNKEIPNSITSGNVAVYIESAQFYLLQGALIPKTFSPPAKKLDDVLLRITSFKPRVLITCCTCNQPIDWVNSNWSATWDSNNSQGKDL